MARRRLTTALLALALVAPMLGCMHRRAHHHEMHERMQAMAARDAKLEELVARMHAASGPERVDAMAAVLDELVDQHRSKHGAACERHRKHAH